MNAEISIVVPHYNSFRYISEGLKLFDKQTCKKFEVIIVDDCSTDGSYEKILELKNSFDFSLSIYQNERNQGPNVARELGVKYAKGKYVCFCDADDWLDENAIEILWKHISDSQYDCVLYDYNQCFQNGEVSYINYTSDLVDAEKEDIIALAKDSLCLMLVEKEVVASFEFPKLYHGEDAAIVPSILAKCRNIGVVNRGLYNYFIRSGSASNTFNRKAFQSMCTSFQLVESKIYEEYREACEFIGVKNLMYSAVLIGIKAKVKHEEIKDVIGKFLSRYPEFWKNKYLYTMPIYKKIFVYLVSKKLFVFLHIFAWLHTKYLDR